MNCSSHSISLLIVLLHESFFSRSLTCILLWQRLHWGLEPESANLFLNVFGRTYTHVLLSCFGFLVTFPLGFKARVGSTLFVFCRDKCNVHSLRSTFGATLADLLTASITASYFPTCISRDGSWLGFERTISGKSFSWGLSKKYMSLHTVYRGEGGDL